MVVTVMDEAQVWEFAFGAASEPRGSTGKRVATDVAELGVIWVDAQSPIHYEFIVNGVPLGPPRVANGGRLVRTIRVRGGVNRFEWSIRHTGPGWRHAVYLKAGRKVVKLSEDQAVPTQNGAPSRAKDIRVRIPL